MIRTTIAILVALGVGTVAYGQSVEELRKRYADLRDGENEPLKELGARYLEELDKLAKQAQATGNLDLLLAIENEKKTFAAGSTPTKFAQLNDLQLGYAREANRLESARRLELTEALRAYRNKISEIRDRFTREGKLEEAQRFHDVVKKADAELAALAGGSSRLRIRLVTSIAPFKNSLGMEFVPLPVSGGPTDSSKTSTRILISRWETRIQDYAAFAAENPEADDDWKDVTVSGIAQKEDHPVVNVNWIEAKAFCEWLTKREQAKGLIAENASYRLPSDHEWSCAIGIGHLENAAESPASKNGKVKVFPWGRGEPTRPVGNYADITAGEKGVKSRGSFAAGYKDGVAFTAPVGTFPPNRLGLYDLGGNVAEWCLDNYENAWDRVLRGGSWYNHKNEVLLSSYRHEFSERSQLNHSGFRPVLVVSPR